MRFFAGRSLHLKKRIEMNEVVEMKGKRMVLTISGFYILVFGLFLLGTFLGSRSVTVIAENLPMERSHRIIIDAGHGGEDGGTTSCTGKLESGYNLEISLRLDDLFHLLGYDTVMIRKTDTAVYTKGGTIAQKKVSDLKERVRIVNSTDGALLVSIHQNHFSDGKFSGPQVFYADNPESEKLAKLLQSQLIASLCPENNRREKKSTGVYLMDQIQCTGVLVECGFLSNAQEETLLRQTEYQKKLVCVIAASVSGYLADT